jgi:hypothetical protein
MAAVVVAKSMLLPFYYQNTTFLKLVNLQCKTWWQRIGRRLWLKQESLSNDFLLPSCAHYYPNERQRLSFLQMHQLEKSFQKKSFRIFT